MMLLPCIRVGVKVTGRSAAVTEEELRDASASDECLDVIRGYLAGRWPRQRDVDPRATGFYQVRDELSQLGPLLFRGERLVVPAALRERVLRNAHEGHQGETRTKQRLRAQFWWPRLDKEVRDLLRSCEVCTQHDGHVRQERPPLQPIPLPDGPWQRLMIDVIGPMQGPQHERYGIVLCDMFSRWPEVALCRDATAASIISFLEAVFSREGLPAHPLLGTQKSCSQPLSNPKVYRPGGTAGEAVQSVVVEAQAVWRPSLTSASAQNRLRFQLKPDSASRRSGRFL
ncbi:uncharacterized protein FJT64_025314 [Amphibalanus amphitrite]|uniref:RNA-directed DNA polymerase n=1 Tax=Amphibalanus amphitrite TaxID=1232801 RepID=A0A6A4WK76_AMPAM|nr:uncharacterized protein FJT64_025314 [Amphibalanus amphitrite]